MGFVCVIPHSIWRGISFFCERNENSVGFSSAACVSRTLQLIVLESKRGGVPVFKRPRGNPKLSNLLASGIAGLSPMRPPGRLTFPMCIIPLRNVPVVKTTVRACTSVLSDKITPATFSFFIIKSDTSDSIISNPSRPINSFCIADLYRALSA